MQFEIIPTKQFEDDLRYNLKKKNKDFVDTIVNQKVASVCINDSNTEIPYEKVKKELKKAFEQILPEKSSFEL